METKTRVLIADTNDDFRRLMTEVLRNEEDMELVGCLGDGVDALAMVAETKPDVLVLDLILAKLDGIEVLRRLPSRNRRAVICARIYLQAAGECGIISSRSKVIDGEDNGQTRTYRAAKPCRRRELEPRRCGA